MLATICPAIFTIELRFNSTSNDPESSTDHFSTGSMLSSARVVRLVLGLSSHVLIPNNVNEISKYIRFVNEQLITRLLVHRKYRHSGYQEQC